MSIGRWVHMAEFQRHNGQTDAAGNPTYDQAGDWVTLLERWPCSRETTSGTETARGRQQVAEKTYLLEGDPYALVEAGIDTTCRVVMGETTFDIVAISGTDALSSVAQVELAKQI